VAHDFALAIGSGLDVDGHAMAFVKLDRHSGSTVPMVKSSSLFKRPTHPRYPAGSDPFGRLSIALSFCLFISTQILKVKSSQNIAAK
jgi:hypothetical protein